MTFTGKILWVSDIHQGLSHLSCPDPTARLAAVADEFKQHHRDADCLVLTGDLAETGVPDEYQAVAKALSGLPLPVLPLTGNHDDRTALRHALPPPEDAMNDFMQYRFQTGDGTLLCLDTLTPGESHGTLCRVRLDWLADALAHAEGPVRLFLHHPPFPLGLPMQDEDRFDGAEALLDLLAGVTQPIHMFFGHVHRPVSGQYRGVPFTGLRALSLQAPPPWPAWTWDSFEPAPERPEYGVILTRGGDITVQTLTVVGKG